MKTTHDLETLDGLGAEVMPDSRDVEEDCSEGSGYVVEVGYPGEGDPSVEKAREMTSAADRIYQFTPDVRCLD